jgi:hypothetical protein
MTQAINYEQTLASYQAADLQQIAKFWGASGNLRKELALKSIHDNLNNPNHVATIIQRLEPFEQAALAFMRFQPGHSVSASALALVLLSAGYTLPTPKQPQLPIHAALVEALTSTGLALQKLNPWQYHYHSAPGGDVLLVSDPRIVEHAARFAPLPYSFATIADPADRRMRRPAQIALDLFGFVETVRSMGGLQINKNMSLRVNDLRKLGKALQWDLGRMSFDGLSLNDPVGALLDIGLHLQLLTITDQERLVATQHSLAHLPQPQLIYQIMNAFVVADNWYEYEQPYRNEFLVRGANSMRLALVYILEQTLSVDGFVALETVSRTLFERLGSHFSLAGPHPRVAKPWNLVHPPRTGSTPVHVQQATEAAWHAKQWEEWQKYEQSWLSHAISGWMYFLGLVEVGIQDSKIVALRLTETGRAALRPVAPQQEATASGPTWVIQPNFEIIVYLEHASPAQIMGIERAAERTQTDTHTANYRLTRDSVARWLNQGETVDGLLTLLGEGIPQNVITSIRDWSGQFERITLRRKVSLLEYPDQGARDKALATGVAGRPMGDRFVLMDTHGVPPNQVQMQIDYQLPPPSVLKITDEGQVSLHYGALDLLGRVLMERWAESETANTWKLTAASVAAAGVSRR